MLSYRSTMMWLAGLVLVCGLAVGCASPQPTRLGKISIEPATVFVRETASLAIDAQGADLKFKWTATRGKLSSSNAPSVIYTAPDAPGPDTVTVEVSGRGGTMVQSITLQVIRPTPAAPPTLTRPTSQPIPTLTASPTRSATATPTALAWITTPAANSTAAQYTMVMGGYRADLSEDIWIVVQGIDGKYYPQSMDACRGDPTPKKNGRWELRITLGSPGDAGQRFGLLLTTANAEASRFMADEMKGWCQTDSFPGLSNLPPGVQEIQRLSLTRSNQKFGPAPEIPNAQLLGTATLDVPALSKVSEVMTLTGSYTGNVQGVWVLVFPLAHGRWYPQSVDPCSNLHTRMSYGRWSTKAIFGDERDPGDPYDIAVVLTDESAHKFLAEHQKQGCQSGNYPGLLTIELPERLTVKSFQRVYRTPTRTTLLPMDDTSGWNTYRDTASDISFRAIQDKTVRAAEIAYTLKPDGWVGIVHAIDGKQLTGEALGFFFKGSGAPNTIELKLIYSSGTVFSVLSSPTATSANDWAVFEAPYTKFTCWAGTGKDCPRGDEKLDVRQVTAVDIAISNKPGGTPGSGRITIDELHTIKK
jgi:hypothetical protein